MTCRRCHGEIVSTAWGWGHRANPANGHHYAVPASRSGGERSRKGSEDIRRPNRMPVQLSTPAASRPPSVRSGRASR